MSGPSIWMRLVLAVLAVWRVTHLLAREDGPADAVARLRAAVGRGWAAKLMDCFKCLSLWTAAPAALFVSRQPLEWVFAWLALSGAACLLEQFMNDPVIIQPMNQVPDGEDSHGMLRPETSGDDPRAIDGHQSVTGQA